MSPLSDYRNIDHAYEWHSAIAASHPDAPDVSKEDVYPLSDYGDESCEEVRASHILEHFSHRETVAVLREWIRVLKPGGWLKIAVPDFEYLAREYLQGEIELPLQGYCMGGQTDENDYHKAIFDADGLTDTFQQLGLANVQRWESEIQDCAALPVSLNLMGQKPEANRVAIASPVVSVPPKGKIIGLMSLPRLTFTDTMHCTLNVAQALNLRVVRSSGVFWGQCMQNLLLEAIAGGAKYALTIDYDSLFTVLDVCELYRIAETTEADALCALQMKRESVSPLFCLHSRAKETEIQIPREAFRQETYPIVTGNFGLCLIRLSALKEIPKPWFIGKPSESGEWDSGRMDEDIHFWHKWNEAGKCLYLVPKVVIGHQQMVCTWPNKELQVQHQYVSDYTHSGKPAWAWG